jgi:hypothetical protein
MKPNTLLILAAGCLLILPGAGAAVGQQSPSTTRDEKRGQSADAPANVLSTDQWRRVDASVDRALTWLASQQQVDGSFPTMDLGQPGVTSLCILAFMAHGHGPDDATYGKRVDLALDYVLQCQKDNGLIALEAPDEPTLSRRVTHEVGNCAVYNHAISSLTISELYGTSRTVNGQRIQSAINKSLAATLEMQHWPKDHEQDKGGWRYLDDSDAADSDLSITGWELKFLRSARNAGFNVPAQPIDDAVAYVRRCYSKQYGSFVYVNDGEDYRSRAMSGAGILALAHAGFHNAPEAQLAGDFLLAHDFSRYNVCLKFHPKYVHDRYHYGLLMACQGMYQLGGKYWQAFFPRWSKYCWPTSSRTVRGPPRTTTTMPASATATRPRSC